MDVHVPHKQDNPSENVHSEYKKPKPSFRCLRKKRPSSGKLLDLRSPSPPISMLAQSRDRVDPAAKKTSMFAPCILLNAWQH